jgi:hypothetical protein
MSIDLKFNNNFSYNFTENCLRIFVLDSEGKENYDNVYYVKLSKISIIRPNPNEKSLTIYLTDTTSITFENHPAMGLFVEDLVGHWDSKI